MKYTDKRLNALMALMVVFGLLAMPLASAEPLNDDFDSATIIGAIPYTDEQSTMDATTALDDPSCAGNGKSVWYAFTPTQDMQIVANTFGSDYDTTLAAYTGLRGSLTQLDCNDQYGGDQSRIKFNVNAGEIVYIMVAAYYNDGGNLKLSVEENIPVLSNLIIEPIGSANSKNGIATIRGTLDCSKPGTVNMEFALRERSGKFFIDGWAEKTLDCDGLTPWEITITGYNGLFVAGKAEAYASVYNYWYEEFIETRGDVLLKGTNSKPK